MIKLLKSFEGWSNRPYKCPAGVWTIGYGHTGKDTVETGWIDENGDLRHVITPSQGEMLLRRDVAWAEKEANKAAVAYRNKHGKPMTQHQFDVIVDFCYNVGSASFNGSTLKRLMLTPGTTDRTIVKELMKWCKATVKGEKVILSGLQKRRAVESAFWMYGPNWADEMIQGKIDVLLWAKKLSGIS